MAVSIYNVAKAVADEQKWSENTLLRRLCDYLEVVQGEQPVTLENWLNSLAEGDLQDEFGLCPKCGSEYGECGDGYCEHDDPLIHQPIGWLTTRVAAWQSADGMSCGEMVEFLQKKWGDWRPNDAYQVVIRKEGLFDIVAGGYIK